MISLLYHEIKELVISFLSHYFVNIVNFPLFVALVFTLIGLRISRDIALEFEVRDF